MSDIYVLMIVALVLLAIIDLVVGVSNDAVNFLNSAVGSRALSIKKIMIIASVGIAIGAISSSGMMEVARKGIFMPSHFYFDEIMYIFIAVMLADILLLDIFNSLGMPTSTTVSIVFELLGAAVAMALIKISLNSESITALGMYINSGKALQIILGILLSIVVAFSVGAIVQYCSRLIYSFYIESKPKYIGSLFGGFAITAITYFIFIKGMKGTAFYSDVKHFIEGKTLNIILVSFCMWTLWSYIFIKFLKINILEFIIGIGTFSLAMAFAGNDLMNFIGVPIAAWNSYQAWHTAWLETGIAPSEFSMDALSKKVPSNVYILLFAGLVMVLTLWFSKKAKKIIETEVNLSRQNEGKERFKSNNISRFIVRVSMWINQGILFIIPKKMQIYIDSRFQTPVISLPRDRVYKVPAFDMVRASINLVVAGILIAIATSLKLPLSTTYVTFMVAMGTSLADRAWGRESAVYRVAGVLNVIGGWFLTAMSAFIISAIFLYLIHLGGAMSISMLLILVLGLMFKNYIKYIKQNKEEKVEKYIAQEEKINIRQVITKSSVHISVVSKRVNDLYTKVVDDLAKQDLNKLKKTSKYVAKLNKEVDALKEDVFYFIKSLDEVSVEASKFYILILGYLEDITQSMSYISKAIYSHVSNNHKNLKKGQLKDLKTINIELTDVLHQVQLIFENQTFKDLNGFLKLQDKFLNQISCSIDNQVSRIRTTESSPKNTTLYFGILLETKDLITSISKLLELYQDFYVSSSNRFKI